VIVFILCRVFVVCIILCAVFRLIVVLFCVLCLIVVPLLPDKYPFAVKINNNNNKNMKETVYDQLFVCAVRRR
jgi:Na+-transporting NADH:ubiquinone oxidoreductase subunit NqrF